MQTAEMPTRATVAAQLQASLAALLTAEQAVLGASLRLNSVRRDLAGLEDYYLLVEATPVDGKNEAIRGAQLRQLTSEARSAVELAEDARLRAGSTLEGARATVSTWKHLARLLAGHGE